jgi:hypothetical protein
MNIPNETCIYSKKYPVIIIEGKTEDAAKRLKQRFQYDGPFIDRILNVDPTRYKYVDYIAKKLEKIIPELAGPNGGLNVQQGEALQDLFGTIIPWFHANVNRITEEDIWTAETAFRNDMNNEYLVPNIEGIARSPKDINQYENPQFIKKLMNTIDSKKSQREIEREIKTQADKIYEDADVLVVRPKSHAASCYYGANTKWCTTQTGNPGYFEKYSRDGNLYYFLNKKTNDKMALYRNESERQTDVYNSQDRNVSIEDLRETFPNQNELIDELLGIGEFIKKLRDFSRGKASTKELEDSDSSIIEVIPADPRGQSKIIFDFGDDDNFLKMLDLSDDDIWFFNVINSHYSDYDFIDSYTVEEDWKEGYIVYGDLNDENMEKLKQISEVILPSKKFNLNSEEYRQELSSVLLDLFERETDNILSDYFVEKNREMTITARESINKELEKVVEDIGFYFKRKYDEVYTTPANIVMLAAKLGINKIDAMSMIKQLIEIYAGNIGNWAEDQYEYQDYENFDNESFNNEVERQLDSIIEKLEDDVNVTEFLEFRKKILSKYDIDKVYKLPKDESIKFRIKNFDKDNIQVVVEFGGAKGVITRKFNEEQFNNLLYQPELFDLFGEV